MPDDPLVTCVMVTGGEGREWWAYRSYRAFVEQERYPNRELLIINESGGTEWEFRILAGCNHPGDGVAAREVMIPYHAFTVGEMRNMAMRDAHGDWILQWDDDDWSHPERVYYQMQFRKEGCCQTLYAQVRYSTRTKTAYTYSNPGTGIAGTILHPKTDFLYPSQTNYEDTLFLRGGWEGRICVLDNYVCPHLYIRFFHGDNLNAAKHVMRKYAEKKWRGRWVDLPEQWGWMSRRAVVYLRHVLKMYYQIAPPARCWSDVLAKRKEEHITDNDTILGLMP